jgi:hypothetical protein
MDKVWSRDMNVQCICCRTHRVVDLEQQQTEKIET